jgi:hypothetical protein
VTSEFGATACHAAVAKMGTAHMSVSQLQEMPVTADETISERFHRSEAAD